MDKNTLLEKIKTGNYTKEKLEAWVSCLPGTCSSRKPSLSKVGDVHMHPIFSHPYVLLQFKNGTWICGLLTSESECTEILCKCESRFFDCNYFTKTLFTASSVVGSFINTYENAKHLKLVLIDLKKEMI
jgi:hypothetical protein